MFDATARVAPEKQDMPACLPLVSSTGDERATMRFKAEAETEVFRNKEGGVSISQECDVTGESYRVYFSGSARVRAVAAEMLRLADEIDAGIDASEEE